MAKDFFVDLSQGQHQPDREERAEPRGPERDMPERSIRNVMVNRRTPGPRHIESREPTHRARSRKPILLLTLSAIIVLALVGFGVLLLIARSSVTVTPRVHEITFDPTATFSAATEGSGLTYTVETITLEEFKTVPAQGTERVEDRATGNITVYNEYSDASVRLIKNTRFEAPSGLIYRIPASVVIPGKSASGPGFIEVTVIADTAGPTYNSGAIDKLTVPGLKGTPAMYNGVYARAPQGMSGGFVGERPAVSADALEAARVELRASLSERLRGESPRDRDNAFVATTLADITFEHLPTTEEAGGARVGEKLVARVPIFDRAAFAASIAQAVSADAGSSEVTLRPGPGFDIKTASSSAILGGSAPLQFNVAGTATLVWNIDTSELKAAILGKDKDAFKPIVAQFPGVEKADAQVAPFWSSTFPSDPDKLDVIVLDPETTP